jgi:hypothetical protein
MRLLLCCVMRLSLRMLKIGTLMAALSFSVRAGGLPPVLPVGLHPDRRRCTFIAASCGSRPDRSKILPNVISAYCEKLYAQARAVFGFHLCIHARARNKVLFVNCRHVPTETVEYAQTGRQNSTGCSPTQRRFCANRLNWRSIGNRTCGRQLA